jgi:ATPase subunit of ABC transporter with duplicated ATPase domains
LVSIIIQKADVLLLDEPTNHLDQISLEFLQKIIEEYCGIVLFISHDRHFLNMMCNKILEIESNKFTIYSGNYESYKDEKRRLEEKQMQDYVVYQKEKKKWEEWLANMRQRASVYINPAF